MATKRDSILRVRLRESEREQIAAAAEAADQTVSELVRAATLDRAKAIVVRCDDEGDR